MTMQKAITVFRDAPSETEGSLEIGIEMRRRES